MTNRLLSGLLLAICASLPASAQSTLGDVLQRHGVDVKGGYAPAFDAHAAPTVPVMPGAVATPLAILTSAAGKDWPWLLPANAC